MKLLSVIVTEILIISFVVTTFNGIYPEQGLFSIVLAGLGFGLLMYMIDPILAFFKFPKNFWGYLIIGSIFSLIYFLLLNIFVVGIIGFQIGTIGGNFGPVAFPVINLQTEFMSVIFAAVYSLILSLFFDQVK